MSDNFEWFIFLAGLMVGIGVSCVSFIAILLIR
jgi:hypothetical protein